MKRQSCFLAKTKDNTVGEEWEEEEWVYARFSHMFV